VSHVGVMHGRGSLGEEGEAWDRGGRHGVGDGKEELFKAIEKGLVTLLP